MINKYKVSIYIPSYNYGRYISKAIESVLEQDYKNWELILIDDGSSDNTAEIIENYKNHSQVRTIIQENKGLNITNNVALRSSSGEYLIRLDADDWLTKDALSIMVEYLDSNPEFGLVYPNYYEVNEKGELLTEVKLEDIANSNIFDLPAHGACTLIRRNILLQIGGYTENFRCQDGYDLWLRFIKENKPARIPKSLFFYRQHSDSISSNRHKIYLERQKINKFYLEENNEVQDIKILGVIIVGPDKVFCNPMDIVQSKRIIDYSVEEAMKSKYLKDICVSTSNMELVDYLEKKYQLTVVSRGELIGSGKSGQIDIAFHLDKELNGKLFSEYDAICFLSHNTPLRKFTHIDWAVQNMLIFNANTVISVLEEDTPFYKRDYNGLKLLSNSDKVRIERESLLREDGSVVLTKINNIKMKNIHHGLCSQIFLQKHESVKVNSFFTRWLFERIVENEDFI